MAATALNSVIEPSSKLEEIEIPNCYSNFDYSMLAESPVPEHHAEFGLWATFNASYSSLSERYA